MINTIVIPAAGRGTRMKKLAQNKPKHLIKVCGRPFICYSLARITRAGFKRIIIVTGNHSTEFERFAKTDGRKFDLELVDQFKTVGREKYGTARPICAVEKTVGSQPFVVVMGDNLYGVNDLKSAAGESRHAIYGCRMPHPDRYGVLEGDAQGKLLRIHEKKPNPPTNVINAGLYTFYPNIFPAARAVKISPRGEYEITDAIMQLARTDGVALRLCRDPWLDFGRLPDIPRAAKFLKSTGEA